MHRSTCGLSMILLSFEFALFVLSFVRRLCFWFRFDFVLFQLAVLFSFLFWHGFSFISIIHHFLYFGPTWSKFIWFLFCFFVSLWFFFFFIRLTPNRLLDVCQGQLEREHQLVIFLVFEHLEEDLAGYLNRIGRNGMPAKTIQVYWCYFFIFFALIAFLFD